MSFGDPWAGNQAGYQAALDLVNSQAGVITNVVNGVPYDANGAVVDTGGSTFADPNNPSQLYGASGAIDMSQYGTTPEMPANYPGGYFGWINHLSDIGAINYDANNQGGLINTIQNNGWMVPLALAGGVAAGGGLAGALGVEAGAGSGAIDSTAAALGGAGGGGAFTPAAGASFALPEVAATIPSAITSEVPAYTPQVPTSTTGTDSVLSAPNVQVPSLGTGMPSGAADGISAPLNGSGAVSGAGSTTLGGGGLTGALPANVVVGDGTLGTTMGATYMASAPGQFALDASGAAIPASSVGIGGYAPTSTALSDLLKNSPSPKQIASAAQGLASLLSPSTALTSAASKLAAGANPSGIATTALTRGNTNPFVQEQNFQVSNPRPNNQALANILRQG